MKHFLSALLVAAATTCVNAQYFQYVYGTTLSDRLNDGHMALQGGTGHFLVGDVNIITGPPAYNYLLAQRTDVTGTTTGGAPRFNNIYGFNDHLNGNVFSV